ncbi:MAG: TonB-dependent receptor, partial [Rhodocyclaceae bacterium]|nr:TonB-dependent receptor [Rhodocyclaceae bacterium]
SQSTVDFSVAYSGIKNLKLYASVQNAGDKQPPFDASVGYYDGTQYDLRGRYVRAGVEYKFK